MSGDLVEDDAVVLPFNDLKARSYTITSTAACSDMLAARRWQVTPLSQTN